MGGADCDGIGMTGRTRMAAGWMADGRRWWLEMRLREERCERGGCRRHAAGGRRGASEERERGANRENMDGGITFSRFNTL